eukprot:12460844-Ditylum_brightwellii.AAC.1
MMNDLQLTITQLYHTMYSDNRSSGKTPEVGQSANDGKIKCYNCGRKGHKAFQCTKPKRKRGSKGNKNGNKKCSQCGNKGHDDKDYWDNPDNKDK